MDEEKDMNVVDKDTAEFLEKLEPAELGRLLNTPAFTGVVLRTAAQSEQLAHSVDQVLDVEFEQMSPAQQDRINRLANKLRQRHAPQQAQPGWLMRQWRIIAAGTRQFGGAEPALVMGAHQKSEPGWPFKLALGGEATKPEAQIEFGLWGVDLVVTNTSAPKAPVILIEVKATRKTVSLKPGEKQSLGDIEDFGLTGSSDKDEIARVLDTTMDVRSQTA